MRKLNDETLNALREMMIEITYRNEFNSYMGIEVVELNENYGKMKVPFSSRITNPYGTIHGGVLSALADTTAGTTACMNGHFVTTVSSSLNYLLPAANTEYIYCEAMKLKTGKHILVYDVRITDDHGSLLDSGEYSFFASGKKVLEDRI
ncbi:MAG: PaaI family thioesterase [Lachnospiraceae bacterium]|nr:PaaI family thioesterase [Lachnospiraceae bacterium]